MNFELKEMKKNIFKSVLRYVLPLYLFTLLPLTASAQKFALIDMEYILKNVPAYERANEQLNQVSKKWQAEVEALNTEASTMYKNYQNEVVFLSQDQKKKRQEAIMAKEKQASDLKRELTSALGVLNKDGVADRATFIIDPHNTIQSVSITADSVGRNTDEAPRAPGARAPPVPSSLLPPSPALGPPDGGRRSFGPAVRAWPTGSFRG